MTSPFLLPAFTLFFYRHGPNRLPRNMRKRQVKSIKRYEKRIPGHHGQVDVKFLNFVDKTEKKICRYQYTAIDDATRIRSLKVYERHNQANVIDFIDYVVENHSFRICYGSEFQAKFHSHVEGFGIHVYIKSASPNLNGKVER